MEVRFTIEDNYIRDLQSKATGARVTQITSEALALFKWAIDEIMKGKKVVALDEETEIYNEITTPILDKVKSTVVTVKPAEPSSSRVQPEVVL